MQPRKTKGALRLTKFFHRFQLVVPRLLMLGACVLLSVVVPVYSWAGGLYITEFGTPSNGVANAGAVALANDASTAWHNPAGLTHVSGSQFMGHGGLLIPNIKFDPDSDTPVPGGDGGQAGNLAPIIGTAFVHSLTDELKLGMALGSLAGAGLDYDNSWAGRRQATEIELLTVTAQPSVAFKRHWLSVGAALQVSYGTLDYKLKAPALPPPTESRFKVDGDDWVVGYTVGVLIDFSEGTRLGVRYQSKNKFNFDGNLKKSGGLINGSVNSKLEILFPQYVEVGFYHEVNDQFALVATVDWEDWSQFNEIPLSVSSGTKAIPTGWDDTYKLSGGIRYRPTKPWLLMTGFAYDSSPVDAKDRTADLPVDRQLRYAVGAQYQWSERLNLGGSFEYIDLGDSKINKKSPFNGLEGDFKRNEMFFIGLNANWTF